MKNSVFTASDYRLYVQEDRSMAQSCIFTGQHSTIKPSVTFWGGICKESKLDVSVLQCTLVARVYTQGTLCSLWCELCNHVFQMQFISNLTLGHIIHGFRNNGYKDIMSFRGQLCHHILLQSKMFETCWKSDLSCFGIQSDYFIS